jgi:polyferredoxin
MKRLLLAILLLAAPGAAWSAENFPPPQFSTGYQFPPMQTPYPRAAVFGWIDLAVLVAALVAAAYLALRVRSRRYLWLLALFSLAYFGFYRHGCICPVGATQNVMLALAHRGYTLPILVGAFFVLPLMVALVAGRAFCAGVCPLGAAQEVVLLRPVRVPVWLEQSLGLIPFFYLGAAALLAWTGSTFLICRFDPFVSFFRLGGSTGLVAFGVGMLALGTVVGRPYCRFLCPYGALLRLLSPLSKWRVKITPADCVNCHLCADACPYGAIKPPTPPETGPRRAGRARLAALLVALPLLMALGAWLGYRAGGNLARVDPTVSLAERVWLEQQGYAPGTTLASDAFYRTGRTNESLYAEAAAIRGRFAPGTAALGAWVALVVGLRLIGLSLRRHRTQYEADQGACLLCGRCYQACPVLRGEDGKWYVAAGEAGET